jgi:hypothetical protein
MICSEFTLTPNIREVCEQDLAKNVGRDLVKVEHGEQGQSVRVFWHGEVGSCWGCLRFGYFAVSRRHEMMMIEDHFVEVIHRPTHQKPLGTK